MVVNFRTRGISRDTRKLVRILTLNKKKKIHGRRRNEVLEINALGSAELMIKEIVYMEKQSMINISSMNYGKQFKLEH
jgi:hypothetical protein